jgi:tetraacyldisaccharide 4'-kinase
LLDRIYGTIALAKRRWVEQHPAGRRRLARPVVSVGNLSVGGTGKTPIVAAIAQWLVDRGERPSILSRGYKRRRQVDGVVVVSDGTRVLADVDRSGDEPLMLARQVPGAVVCVGPDRYLSGVLAERRFGCTVHVLDDGFQHVTLARDLDVLVTAMGEIPNGRVLPAGRLREPMDAAARAHFLIVSDATATDARNEAWTLGISQAAGMTRRLGAPRWLQDPSDGGHHFSGAKIGGDDRPRPDSNDPVVAIAGIAHPARFFDALRDAGFNLVRTLPFADHHVYTARDLQTMSDALTASGATAILTTEKDAVKLDAFQPLAFPVAAMPLEITFDPWPDVTAAIDAALMRARGAA